MRFVGRSRRRFLKEVGVCGTCLGTFGPWGLGKLAVLSQSNENSSPTSNTFAKPPISQAAFERRIARVRSTLKSAGVSCLVLSSVMNHAVRYLGFFDPDFQGRASGAPQLAVVLLPLEGKPVLFLQTFTSASYLLPRAQAGSLIQDVRLVPGTGETLLEKVASELSTLGLDAEKIGLAGNEIDWAVRLFLSPKLPRAGLVDVNAILDRLRIVKDAEEIALLRKSAAIGDAAMRAVEEYIHAGQLDFDLYRVAESKMRSHGADEDTFILMGIGPNENPMLMESLNSRKILPGNVVVFEVLPFYRHYNTELAVTFAVGKVSATQRKAAAACESAFHAGLKQVRPGKPAHHVLDAALRAFRDGGFDSFTHGPGHFIGLDNYEGPPLRDPELILEPGMVFSFHPNVVKPGEVKEEISGNILVTEKGFENLSKYPTAGMRHVAA